MIKLKNYAVVDGKHRVVAIIDESLKFRYEQNVPAFKVREIHSIGHSIMSVNNQRVNCIVVHFDNKIDGDEGYMITGIPEDVSLGDIWKAIENS